MTLHVACAADENYAGHCAAMVHSLLTSNPGDQVRVHYLHGPDFPQALRNGLAQMVHDLGADLELHVVPDDAVAGLPAHGRISATMWYRIFLPDLAPDVDRILYLDADTLVLAPIGPLVETPLEGAYVAAVPNVFLDEHVGHPERLGLAPGQRYFNSGVLVLDLARMRQDACTDAILTTARRRPLMWPDQDALNLVLGPGHVDVHPRWNCMNSLFLVARAREVFAADVLEEARTDPAILHFEGPGMVKPWHHLSKHPFRDRYTIHRRSTPWPDAPVEGRTWSNRLLRALPTPTAIRLLGRWYGFRARHSRLADRLGLPPPPS